jgi:hypothetical protein
MTDPATQGHPATALALQTLGSEPALWEALA